MRHKKLSVASLFRAATRALQRLERDPALVASEQCAGYDSLEGGPGDRAGYHVTVKAYAYSESALKANPFSGGHLGVPTPATRAELRRRNRRRFQTVLVDLGHRLDIYSHNATVMAAEGDSANAKVMRQNATQVRRAIAALERVP